MMTRTDMNKALEILAQTEMWVEDHGSYIECEAGIVEELFDNNGKTCILTNMMIVIEEA